jgi:two-component system, NtrC family, response regulator AtoC
MPDSGVPLETWEGNDRMKSVPAVPQLSATESRSEKVGWEPLVRLDNRRALIAVSPAMHEVRRQVEQVAEIDATVLLLGENGVGKEVVARMIHKLSERSSRKFMKANCALRPEELLESELFGHGADAGAPHLRAGRFELCHKGTILLDEIAELPAAAQAKLLRVLQDGEFLRSDSASTAQSDVRVIATSSRDLLPALESGAFRADLYYRLNVMAIRVPALRERSEDLPYLLNHLMTSWAANYGRPRLPITRRILEACAGYSWPGNVRELENFVKRYLVLGDQDLALEELEYHSSSTPSGTKKASIPIDVASSNNGCDLKSLVRDLKQDAERTAIVRALEQAGGNRQDAANLLQISLRSLHYKMRAYGIDSSSSRARKCAHPREAAKLRPITSVARNAHSLPHIGGGKLITMNRAAWPPVR